MRNVYNISLFLFVLPYFLANSSVFLPVEEFSTYQEQTIPTDIESPAEVKIAGKETKLEEEIPDILKRIAFCESGDRHFNENGEVLRGKMNPCDIGRYQINEIYHAETAKEMGIDIYTEEGNEKYALWLYENQGTEPWNNSIQCWKR